MSSETKINFVINNIESEQESIEVKKAKFWNDFGAYVESQSVPSSI